MNPFTPKFVKIAVLRADGGTSIMSFCTLGRGHILPPGGLWVDSAMGVWARPDSDANIAQEVARTDFGSPAVSWQRVAMNREMHDDISMRDYRNALNCTDGALAHDVVKARTLHRDAIRAERAGKLTNLDGQWMRAVGRKDKTEEDRIEIERQKWRDAPADPRIEAATSVEELKQIKVA